MLPSCVACTTTNTWNASIFCALIKSSGTVSAIRYCLSIERQTTELTFTSRRLWHAYCTLYSEAYARSLSGLELNENSWIHVSFFLQAIGYGFTAVTFSMQSLMKWACDRLTGWKRLVVADLFLAFSFIGTINVWRGIWQLLDIYCLPGKFSAPNITNQRQCINHFFFLLFRYISLSRWRWQNVGWFSITCRLIPVPRLAQLLEFGACAWRFHRCRRAQRTMRHLSDLLHSFILRKGTLEKTTKTSWSNTGEGRTYRIFVGQTVPQYANDSQKFAEINRNDGNAEQ